MLAFAQSFGGHERRRYLTYPHCNGFADGGRSLVLGQTEPGVSSIWRHDLETGREERLCEFAHAAGGPDPVLYFDIAASANMLVVRSGGSVWRLDLNAPAGIAKPERLWHGDGADLCGLVSVSAGGSRVLFDNRPDNALSRWRLIELDLRREPETRARIAGEFSWWANHFHFCPHDETWIGFSHEGPTSQIPDRVWAMHPRLAPQGRCLFRNGAANLCVGHERWAFHASSAFAVAYGESPSGPRGVYEIRAPETETDSLSPPRLVSEGDRDWHVDISRCGRWAVVDTTGPHDAPGRGWQDARDISDILLIDTATGRREFLARSRQDGKHPCHPHPVFSPDGSAIFYNEAAPDGGGHRVIAVSNPWINK
ncbi:MAG: hypothetical protein LBK99_23535 [Opitutaceae bacterium]|jgi:hypothetical protein|nr:hypothetical protein [Opitutaceae bacterium]